MKDNVDKVKIDIFGNGAEVVIGKLPKEQTNKLFNLLSEKKDEMDEVEFENIMERPWNEIDDIFHWNGAWGSNYGFYLTDENDREVIPEGSLSFDYDDDDCFKKHPNDGADNYIVGKNKIDPLIDKVFLTCRSKDLSKEMRKFIEEGGVFFMCVSEEKGHWGTFELQDNFDKKKLAPIIVRPDIGGPSECLYGFLYDGKEVEVEFTGDTVGKTRTFFLIEPNINDEEESMDYDFAEEWYM